MFEAPPQPHQLCGALLQFNDLTVEPLSLLVVQSVRTLSTMVVSPVDKSHTLAILSPLPVASCPLSGLKATLLTLLVRP